MQRLKDFEPAKNITDQLKFIKQAEISGTVVIIDLTNSTGLKENKQFPGWLPDFHKFHEIVFGKFKDKGVKWYKFLGDAYLFFFSKDSQKVPSIINYLEHEEIYSICKSIMNSFWNHYKDFSPREKGGKKHIEFREITCAIDTGSEILNWATEIDDNKDSFDPIGSTIDRCFRISNLAGPSQLLVSRQFFKALTTISRDYEKEFENINLSKALKGFTDKEKNVYLSIPSEEQINYFLSDDNVDLVEEIDPMTTKLKLHLFRRDRKFSQERKNGTL